MHHIQVLVSIALAAGSVAWAAAPSHSATATSFDESLAVLRESDDAWRRNDEEFRSLRQSQAITGQDAEEFASFIADLHRRMLEDCHAFRKLGGDPEAMGFDCGLPEEQLAAKQALPQSPSSVQTEEEKTAALDAALAESLGEFDEALQRSQTEIREQRESRNSGGGNLSSGGAIQPGGGASGVKWSNPDSSQAESGSNEPGAGPGVDKQEQDPVVASEAGDSIDAGDDDVVARQLREAAEKETDPILKEKLWVEYRKYRDGKASSN